MYLNKMIVALLFFAILSHFSYAQEAKDDSPPQLLIKIPTRSRPAQFFDTLDLYYQKLSGQIPYWFLITCDLDDHTMNCPEVKERFARYPNLTVLFSQNTTKVEAYNRDIEKFVNWFDILLITSDDMKPVVDGYDKIIADQMLSHFPDFDGVLNFHDGHIGEILNTLPIMGKKYYERFGYAYHPDYHSLWCDNEVTIVSRMLGKEAVIDQVIIHHNHPVYKSESFDDLLKRNESFYTVDQKIYEQRRARCFDLENSIFEESLPKEWSILICTLEEREESFQRLYHKLKKQIQEEGLEDKVEVLFYLDNREISVGAKRNALLRQSKGLYINYIDDDDDVHDHYVKMIYEKLKSRPDCVSLTGIITFNHENPKIFIHSLQYRSYFKKDEIYYRPPNHLNPIKRAIGCQFFFPNQSYSEDTDWAMQIAKSGLLKTEEVITEPYYFYLYEPNKSNKREEKKLAQGDEWNQRIYLATYPRSGNHWIRFFIEEASRIATSSVYQDSDFRPHLNTPFSWGGYCAEGGYEGNCRYPEPHESVVIKTHFPSFPPNEFDKKPCAGVIRIIRNPIDSIGSYYVYAHPSDDNYKIPSNTIKDYLNSWRKFQEYWDQDPNILTIRYEDLMDNPTYYLAKILETCKYEYTEKDLQRAINKFPAQGKPFKHLKHFYTDDVAFISENLKDLLDAHGYQIPLTLDDE